MPTTGRTLIALVAIATAAGGYIADWNETHVYNPRWPPHAKFHNAQTMSTGLILGLGTLYQLFFLRRPASPARERDALLTAAFLASVNWVSQLSAALYPGSLPVDPEYGDGFPQAYADVVLLSMVGVGVFLERRRIAKVEVVQVEDAGRGKVM